MMKATYKECARDKLDDRTATLERWVLFSCLFMGIYCKEVREWGK